MSLGARESEFAIEIRAYKDVIIAYENRGENQAATLVFKNRDYSTYYARSYFYAYKAAALVLRAKTYRESNNIAMEHADLDKALVCFRKSIYSPQPPKEFINKWKLNALKQAITCASKLNKYYELISYVEELSSLTDIKAKYGKFYYRALLATGQATRAKRYQQARTNSSKILTSGKRRQKQEDIKTGNIATDLSRLRTFYSKLEKQYYNEDFWLDINGFLKIYFRLKSSPKIEPKDLAYIDLIEKLALRLPPEKLFDFIRSLWKRDYTSLASKYCKQFKLRYSWHKLYPKISHYSLRLAFESGSREVFIQAYNQHLNNAHLDEVDEAAYFVAAAGFAAYAEIKNSREVIDKYRHKYDDNGSLTEFFLYWELVTGYHMLSALEQSRYTYEREKKFIATYPFSSYSAMLVYQHEVLFTFFKTKLSTLNSMPSKGDRKTIFPANISEQIKIRIGEELLEFGLVDVAASALASVTITDRKFFLWRNSLYRKTGYSFGLIVGAFKFFAQNNSNISLQEIFPNSYQSQVNKNLVKNNLNVPAELILSLIRQESAFAVDAVSAVGARGLMQLMPMTAKQIAAKLNKKHYCLNCPEDNIELGVHYLSHLLKLFNNNVIYALCGYNAGPKVTSKWIEKWGRHHPLVFMELIPYKETRSYVKLIFRNILLYNILYKQSSHTGVLKSIAVKDISAKFY